MPTFQERMHASTAFYQGKVERGPRRKPVQSAPPFDRFRDTRGVQIKVTGHYTLCRIRASKGFLGRHILAFRLCPLDISAPRTRNVIAWANGPGQLVTLNGRSAEGAEYFWSRWYPAPSALPILLNLVPSWAVGPGYYISRP
jgi:hypothetical protein